MKNITLKLFIIALFAFLGTSRSMAGINYRFNDTTLKPLDTARYDSLMRKLANGDKTGKWPVKSKVYPLPGAILPFNRIVAYYGNMYSKNMGVLGQYPPKVMLKKLQDEVKAWQKADTTIPVKPALHRNTWHRW